MASELFEAQRESREAVAIWTVDLLFPAFGDLAAKSFYWSSGKNIELENGQVYSQTLATIPRGRGQMGRGNDYAEFSVSNTDFSIYQHLLPYQDLMEKAEVIIRKAYEIDHDLYESEVMLVGFVKDFTLDDTDKAFKFTAYSDMSRPNLLVGNRILTRERCGTEFNFNGLNDPAFHRCGWTVAQGGNPLFCSKLEKGVDGCESHNNRHRFFAVPALASADITVTSDGGNGGGIGGGDGGPCFSEKAYVLMADWSLMPIHKVKKTDLHMGFDVFDNDRMVAGEIYDTKKTLVDEIYNAEFEHASFEVRKEHLFYLGFATFAPVGVLGPRPALGINSEKKPARSHLLSIDKLSEMVFVYNLWTSTGNYIVTDAKAEFFYFVHNQKAGGIWL